MALSPLLTPEPDTISTRSTEDYNRCIIVWRLSESLVLSAPQLAGCPDQANLVLLAASEDGADLVFYPPRRLPGHLKDNEGKLGVISVFSTSRL